MIPTRLMQVLVAPYISEKALRVADYQSQIVFKVLRNATKQEIKQAVEFLFNVKVKKIRTIQVKGKRKNLLRVRGMRNSTRSNWKKAYIGLQPGFDINFRISD